MTLDVSLRVGLDPMSIAQRYFLDGVLLEGQALMLWAADPPDYIRAADMTVKAAECFVKAQAWERKGGR